MLRSSVDRFGVTYQGKVGDDVEVRVNGIVERFVKLVLLFKTSHDDHENSNALFFLNSILAWQLWGSALRPFGSLRSSAIRCAEIFSS